MRMTVFFIVSKLVGSWLLTAREYKRKSVEPYLCLFFIVRFRNDPVARINNECPRRYVHRCGTQRIKHTKGHLSLSCFGLRNFPDFTIPKQALINAFLLCLERFSKRNFELRIMNFELDIIPPTFPSVNHFGCKITNLF